MRIGSPFPHKKARIEIIPLIDIMFFLLASFMLASLSMMRLQSIKMDLPTATVASKAKVDIVNLNVKKNGDVYVDKDYISMVDLRRFLSNKVSANTNLPVYIKGDKEATHGMVISVLDLVKQEGVEKVSFAIAPPSQQK
jgi:biopolymer transport protein ExbD